MVDITRLLRRLPPQEMIKVLNEVKAEFKDKEKFKQSYKSLMRSRITIEGKGFKPMAVTLGGLYSIAGAIVAVTVFDTIDTVITSPQVEQRHKMFELSNDYLRILTEDWGLNKIIVTFEGFPDKIDTEKLLQQLARGAIVLQGASTELAAWLGQNSGCGRLLFYRPGEDYARFIYL